MPIDPHLVWADKQVIEGSEGIGAFVRPGMLLNENQLITFYAGLLRNLYISIGAGPFNGSLQTIVAKYDKYKTAFTPPNSEQVGLTFITRPKLNLSNVNIRQDPTLNALDTGDPVNDQHENKGVPFMLRALLDTKFCEDNAEAVNNSPLVDIRSPFMTPLCNCLTDISGFPDFILETETTEGGYHNEDITYAKGSDMLYKSGELTLGFKDIWGGINLALIYMWIYYVALQNKGIVVAYPHHINMKRLNYTVSIYRFILDPSRKYIVKWAKATGCFPKAASVGALFNFSEGESVVEAANKFSVPFVYNGMEYSPKDGPIRDFNRLMRRYVMGIDTDNYKKVPEELQYNFLGYPYIRSTSEGFRLEFRAHADDISAYNESTVDIAALVKSYQALQQATLEKILAEDLDTELKVQNADDTITDVNTLDYEEESDGLA